MAFGLLEKVAIAVIVWRIWLNISSYKGQQCKVSYSLVSLMLWYN